MITATSKRVPVRVLAIEAPPGGKWWATVMNRAGAVRCVKWSELRESKPGELLKALKAWKAVERDLVGVSEPSAALYGDAKAGKQEVEA